MIDAARFRAEAIPLVEVDDDSKFHLNTEAREILGSLHGKICVVSVAGLYRTGKSSLLNFLLSEETGGEGFKVGPTVRRCTRGIWFWGEPLLRSLPSGEPCWVIILDTEGLGGLEADQHYDTRIFSLATLLCSTLVYNSLGSIDEAAISSLSFIANLSRNIRVRDDDELMPSTTALRTIRSGAVACEDNQGTQEFHNFFPSFVWVVRDFVLDLVDECNNTISADEYLEKSLRPQVGFDAATTERNRIRSILGTFFPDRACFPLVRPLGDEDRLQQIDKVAFGDLRPEFQDGLRLLKMYLYETHLRPKEVYGRPLNGSSFVAMAEQYVSAIERGSIPTITTAWEEVMTKECEYAMRSAIAAYEEALDNELKDYAVYSTDKLYRAHILNLQVAQAVFSARAAGDTAPTFQRTLEADLAVKLEDRVLANDVKSNGLCSDLIAKLHTAFIVPKMSRHRHHGDMDDSEVEEDSAAAACTYRDFASLKFDVQTVVSRYTADAVGPAKDPVLCDYAFTKVLESAHCLFENLNTAYEKRLAKVEAEASEAASERAKLAAREKVVQDALESQQKELILVSSQKMQLEAQAKATEARVSSLFGELQRTSRRKEELEHDIEDMKEALESEQTWQTQLHERLEDMETKSSSKEFKLNELSNLLDQHKLEVSEKNNQLEQQRELEKELTKRIASVEAKHADIVETCEVAKQSISKLERERDSVVKQYEFEIEERKQLLGMHGELQAMLDAAKREYAELDVKFQESQSQHGASARELEAALAAAKKDIDGAHASIEELTVAIEDSHKVIATRDKTLDEKSKVLDKLHVELDGAHVRHGELLRVHSQLSNEYRAFQQKMNQRVTYLKTQLDEHQSTSTTTSTELQRKVAREAELEKRLEVEINLRASLQAERDAQVFDLQKQLAEATTRLRQTESRAAQFKTFLDTAQAELNKVSAQRAVLLDEKDKMQALWEKSLCDHFNSLHETQSELEDTKGKIKNSAEAAAAKIREQEEKLEEYRRIVERAQTRKEGLLRKRTRSRLVKQTWHVKLFRLVGNSILHRDPDNIGTGEKNFTLDARSQCETLAEVKSVDDRAASTKFVPNSFKVSCGGDDLILAAIDRSDMEDWIQAISDVITDMQTNEARTAETKERFLQDAANDAVNVNVGCDLIN